MLRAPEVPGAHALSAYVLIASIQLLLASVILAQSNTTYAKAVEKVKTDPSRENIIELAGHLRGAGRYMKPNDDRSDYRIMQEALMSIPGHAQYFADIVRKEQEAVRSVAWHTGARNRYDFNRNIYLCETLIHLPSPETVRILGELLYDEKDTPPPPGPEQDWIDIPSNAYMTLESLQKIGLEDLPLSGAAKGHFVGAEGLKVFRAWWEQVKSGQRTISFKGQDVAYRFKSDGTWDILPIGAKNHVVPPAIASIPAPIKSEPTQAAQPVATSIPWYYWLCGSLLLAVFGWSAWFICRCKLKK